MHVPSYQQAYLNQSSIFPYPRDHAQQEFRLHALGMEKLSNCLGRTILRTSWRPTIILEAVTSYDLWTWPAYFGLPGSNNEINAIQSSILFDKLARVITPANYNILGKVYDDDYYLAGGTYPK